ncbi:MULTISPECIES: DUF742 domain-containing protein [Pseudonocardia]|uniref:DUF742 domain-containing protein n=2 Tax=Pseudonocardia TaxID=1847 RepID=A0A1Y2N869_PSEAH|nr:MULTISPECIES: DUF742 domain-containing protein [Pseudonocardia]OSY43128.1 hypothetical protein BG845_00733 [Pseudonocardia autotrophica]TDN71616.1 uncharacterized protein DUF742 [Pseudonocardia autotrophica]BBG02303.1 hypothetical protein Pdca_35120 [Pseudonocardia autotrophica]GEC23361.1 hypothetical protein PSA01_03900 [Pseudonocardia saturnea]
MAPSDIGRTGARFGARPARHAPDPDHPHGPAEDGEEPITPEPEEDLVGVTGARFGGHSAKRSRKTRKERAAERAAAAEQERIARQAAAGSHDGIGDAGDGTAGTVRDSTAGTARDSTAGTARDSTAGTADTAPLPVVSGAAGPAPRSAFTAVRPYVITGGRTRVRMELRLETLISVRPVPGPAPVLGAEKATVLKLCAQARSVSEVAALAAVPLGVARVLIDDLATEGRLTVHGVSSAEDGPSMALLDRVLSGLRNL